MHFDHLLEGQQLSFGLCFLLGALHALEPGHGKTALVAHLLSRKSRTAPAVAALSTAASHSFSILLIAAFAHGLLGLAGKPSEETFRHLQAVSGLLFFGLAAWTLRPRKADSCCPLEPANAWTKDLRLDVLRPAPRSWSTALLGLAIGLIPCPTAILALSQAVLNNNWRGAVLVVLTFGAGIFLALFLVSGIVSWKLGPALAKQRRFRISPRAFALLQAAVIAGTGAWQLYGSL